MTKAQVVRRKFKSALPRKIENRLLGEMTAIARTLELLEKFRGLMQEAGLSPSAVSAALVYSDQYVDAMTIPLSAPEDLGEFVDAVLALDKSAKFLGVLFLQIDYEADRPEKTGTAFVWPFLGGPETERALIAVRKAAVKGVVIEKPAN